MRLDSHTSQEELLRLSESVLRRELLLSTPLNLRRFLRYLLLFLLFPGMVFGFRTGMLITLLFCALLGGVLVAGSPAAATIAIYSWLSLGLGVLLFVQAGVILRARRDNRRRRLYRPARAGQKHAVDTPTDYPLRWHPRAQDDFLVARLVLRAPKRGIYAILLTVEAYDGRRIITGGVTGTSIVHAQGKPGQRLQSLALYRLEAGCHELSWALPQAARGAPRATVTLLNRL